MSDWISVTERMPDHTNTVIVGDEHGVWFANRENKLEGWYDTCGGGMMENVTHWMELPEPPGCTDQTTPSGKTTPD